jgi:two-component system, sensor histidine kinase and response regulator
MIMEKLKILVVDDELGMRLAVTRVLQNAIERLPDIEGEVGFEMMQAGSGEEALDIIHATPPDILLLDHKLPGISGIDVLERIVSENHDFLTVMITAYASLETAIKATKLGSYDFLAKPFTPEELRVTVRKTAKHLILQRQARKHAEEKRQVRFQFISVLAHELKAPLASIEGYLRILEDPAIAADQTSYKKMIGRSLSRLDGMRKLIMDLLDLTRIESGQKARSLAEIDVREIANTAIETSLPKAMERNIQIELHSPDSVKMMGDRSEIEIILNNLITNAIKYNKDGGKADINISQNDHSVAIEVSDSGIGMRKEDIPRLFVEFFRIKNDKTKAIIGSGLGLAIVKKLTTLYDGSISVESEPDKGSKFTVVLCS